MLVDMDEMVHGGSSRDHSRQGFPYTQFSVEEGVDSAAAAAAAEVPLRHAIRSGDSRLVERMRNGAEGHGLAKAKITLARSEARWLHAKQQLEEALLSGDARLIEQATLLAEREGIDPAQLMKERNARPPRTERRRLSIEGLAQFIAVHSTMWAAASVLLYEGCAYNLVYLCKILPAVGKDHFFLPFAIAFNLCWGLAVWSFLRAHLTDPGSVPPQWYDFVHRMGDALNVAPARLEWQPGQATLCKRCRSARPERAHHCHVCEVCVLRMDHHCPWIDNCVGFRNHKFFLLLVGYGFLASFVALATSSPELVRCVAALAKLQRGNPWEEAHLRFCDVYVFLIFGLLALVFGVLFLPMVFTHFELAAYNVTTIEGHYERSSTPNPFNHGTKMANYEELFGAYGLDWFLPVQPSYPVADGISFAGACVAGERSTPEEGDSAEDQLWRRRYQVGAGAGAGTRRNLKNGFSWWFTSAGSSKDEPRHLRATTRVTVDSDGRRFVSI